MQVILRLMILCDRKHCTYSLDDRLISLFTIIKQQGKKILVFISKDTCLNSKYAKFSFIVKTFKTLRSLKYF